MGLQSPLQKVRLQAFVICNFVGLENEQILKSYHETIFNFCMQYVFSEFLKKILASKNDMNKLSDAANN